MFYVSSECACVCVYRKPSNDLEAIFKYTHAIIHRQKDYSRTCLQSTQKAVADHLLKICIQYRHIKISTVQRMYNELL